jgi:hypothetical protein
LSGWNIEGATCSHLLKGLHREEVVRFAPGEFEKMYAPFEKTAEIILHIPFTAETARAAVFIAKGVNKTLGYQVLALREVTAISHTDTRFTFVISDYDFHATKRRAFEMELRRALDEYFRSHAIVPYPESVESEMEEDLLRIVESTFR